MSLQAKLNSLPFQPLLFIPRTVEELWQYASILCNNDSRKAGELALCYSAFAHHFDFDLGRVLMNTHVIQGKPCLNADGLAAVARSSGLIRFMRFTVLNDERCVYEMARADEPEGVTHTYEYTIKDAEDAGHLNKAMWKKHRRSMLRVRALAAICRAVVPDAVSGVYSVDEMADSMDMSEQEREQIVAQSIGEEVSRAPQAQRAPQPSRAPQPQRPQHTVEHVPQSQPPQHPLQHSAQPEPSQPVQEIEEPLDTTPRQPRKLTPVRDFSTMGDLAKAIEHHGITRGEVNDVATRLGANLAEMSSGDRGRFFYEWIFSAVIRRSRLQPNWWRDMGTAKPIIKALRDEFPTLPLTANSRAVGQNLGNPMMWEALSVSAHFTGEKLEEARSLMSELLKDGGSQELMAKIARL